MPKGNDPIRWQKFLDFLDDKLQLGLLDRIRKTNSYHFEGDTLFIEAGSEDDANYLGKEPIVAQLQIFAQEATGVGQIQVTAAKN